MEWWGTFTLASESLFLKHYEGFAQHETLFVVSPGSQSIDPRVRPNRKESNGGPLLKPSCYVALGDWHILQHAEDTAANVSCSKTLYLVNSVYTNNDLNARVHV